MAPTHGTLVLRFVHGVALLTAGLGVVALSLGFAGPARAHDRVVDRSPASDSTVTTSLNEVSVTFAEPPLGVAGARVGLEVLDPSGKSVGVGDVRVEGATLTRRVATTVQGVYTVQYQTVASDGHNTGDSYRFTFAGPVAVAEKPSAGTSVPIPGGPLTAQPSSTGTAAVPAPTSTMDQGPGAEESPAAQVGLLVGAIIGGLAVAGAIVIIITTTLRRRGNPPTA